MRVTSKYSTPLNLSGLLFDMCVYIYFSEFSKSPQILHYSGHHCNLRRSDGARVATATSPFPALLHQHVATNNWDAALRLCRFVQVRLSEVLVAKYWEKVPRTIKLSSSDPS